MIKVWKKVFGGKRRGELIGIISLITIINVGLVALYLWVDGRGNIDLVMFGLTTAAIVLAWWFIFPLSVLGVDRTFEKH